MAAPPKTAKTDARARPAETTPGRNCPLCPRLVAFRKTWREQDSLAKFGYRPLELPLLEQCVTQVIVKLGVGGDPLSRV